MREYSKDAFSDAAGMARGALEARSGSTEPVLRRSTPSFDTKRPATASLSTQRDPSYRFPRWDRRSGRIVAAGTRQLEEPPDSMALRSFASEQATSHPARKRNRRNDKRIGSLMGNAQSLAVRFRPATSWCWCGGATSFR